MTTIAYKDGVMAGDTQCTTGNHQGTMPTKVYKRGKYLIGGAGDTTQVSAIIHWFSDPQFQASLNSGDLVQDILGAATKPCLDWVPREELNFSVMVYNTQNNRLYVLSNNYIPYEMYNIEFYAIGTGADFAMGAMAQGASAEEAVRTAGSLDIDTNEIITSVGG